MRHTVAVTVQQGPSVVLDENYRIVEMNEAASPWFAKHRGELVFDCFPGSEPLFRPHYDRARRSGSTITFAQFYGGYVTQVTAAPSGRRLVVSWETLTILDSWTLDGLRSSLDDALARLEEAEHGLEHDRIRRSLKLVEGGL